MTNQRGMVLIATVALGLASTSGVLLHKHDRRAEATLRTASGVSIGAVEFRARKDTTEVTATLRLPAGLTAMDAFHGFHVHANDNPANGEGCIADPAKPSNTWFVSADGHLKEGTETHGMHTGDMPSVMLNQDGTATLMFTDSRLKVADLKDKAVVLHAGPDNFGNVPVGDKEDQYTPNSDQATTKTSDTGNAGDRIACGVVATK